MLIARLTHRAFNVHEIKNFLHLPGFVAKVDLALPFAYYIEEAPDFCRVKKARNSSARLSTLLQRELKITQLLQPIARNNFACID